MKGISFVKGTFTRIEGIYLFSKDARLSYALMLGMGDGGNTNNDTKFGWDLKYC